MYTVCPKCALPLAVTAADLRAGQGYVRCGRCANVFNALLRLSEESALAAQEGGLDSLADIEMEKASATMSRPALTEPEPEVESESDPELDPFEPMQAAAPAPAAQDIAPEPLFPEDEEEFFDPESTNPKIGIAPLKLIAPREAERSQDFWHMEASPPSPSPAMTSEESASQAEESAEVADEVVDEGVDEAVDEAVDEVVDVEPDEEFIDEEIDEEEETGPRRATGTFETIVLEGDTFLQTEETIPEEVLASEIANVSRRLAEAHNTAKFAHLLKDHFEDEAEPEAAPPPEVAAFLEATGDFRHKAKAKASVATDDPSAWFRTIKSWGDWRVNVGAVALALMLMLQALNHWRDDLAARPGWFGAMRHLSSMLGEPLHPNWDLGAYDVRQLGAAADSADNEALKVRLSLTNVGQRAQALPLIRLTLRDRYGKSVSRGELAPEQYLPPDEHGQLMIRRDQRIDTEIRVLDPTGQASSFELDVCVAAAGGGLRCAGDTPALSARPS